MPTERDWFDALSAGVSAVLLVPVVLALLVVVCAVGFLFSIPFVGAEGALLGSVVGTLGAAVAAVVLDTPAGWSTRLRVASYLLAIALLGVTLLAAIWLAVLLPASLVTGGLAVRAASAVALALWCALGLAALLAIRETGSPIDWSLTLRMVAAVLVLALLTVSLLGAVWVVAWLFAFFLIGGLSLELPVTPGVVLQSAAATLLSLAVVAAFVRATVEHVTTVERRAEALPVPTEEAPGYYALTARVAMQLDVPMPTLAHSPHAAPEAMVVGFRPQNVHLVLSDGTTRPLDADELGAVIAHELAHVANRDAMVTTAVSVPVVLAERFHEWSLDDGSHTMVSLAFLPVTWTTRLLGRIVVAVLARTRETAADRTAAVSLQSPAALAGALRTLDERVRDAPEADLRRAAAVSSLSILPLDPSYGARRDEERDGLRGALRSPVVRLHRRLFRTHPPTEQRLEDLEQFLESGD